MMIEWPEKRHVWVPFWHSILERDFALYNQKQQLTIRMSRPAAQSRIHFPRSSSSATTTHLKTSWVTPSGRYRQWSVDRQL